MNTKKKEKRISRFILVMIITFLSVTNKYFDSITYAEALPDFVSGSTTVADIVMTYMASAGSFVANQRWITQLYQGLGDSFGTVQSFVQDSLLTVDNAGNIVATQALEDAISQSSTYGALNLDTLFNVSSAEAVAGGGVAATGAGTLAGALGGVATTGALPLALGVTGAYWGGIGLGTLIAHATGLYAKPVYYGLEVNTNKNYIDGIPPGGNAFSRHIWGATPSYEFYTADAGVIGIAVYSQTGDSNDGDVYSMRFYNPTDSTINMYTFNPSQDRFTSTTSINPNSYTSKSSYQGYTDNCTVLQSWNGNILQQIKDGDIKPLEKYSPDLICSDGNARGQYSQEGGYTIPNMTPEVNPTGQSIVPGGTSLQDWLRWANGAKGNSDLNDPDANADIMQEILEAIRKNNPSPGVNPDPNTNPNPTPTPTPVPKPDYDPDNPNQPEYDPKETEGLDDIANGDPWTTPDLLDKFPFCLPRDVLRCFEKLDVSERMPPSISWHFVTPLGIHFDFDLDLDDYEGVATILRTLELIAFIIGLALATRNLIGR